MREKTVHGERKFIKRLAKIKKLYSGTNLYGIGKKHAIIHMSAIIPSSYDDVQEVLYPA